MLLPQKSQARSDDDSFGNGPKEKLLGLHDSRLIIIDLLWVSLKTMTDHTCWCLIALELVLDK